jgi:hypothetical protein
MLMRHPYKVQQNERMSGISKGGMRERMNDCLYSTIEAASYALL